jgi:hypothetical protein
MLFPFRTDLQLPEAVIDTIISTYCIGVLYLTSNPVPGSIQSPIQCIPTQIKMDRGCGE